MAQLSIWQIIITAIAGPALILAIKEFFDYLKRGQELRLATIKLVSERKLHLAEQAINVWKGQEGVLVILIQLFERTHENIMILSGDEFQKLINTYCTQLDEIGKKSWEASNAVELYFDIKVTATNYDPNKVLSQWLANIHVISSAHNELSEQLDLTDNPEEIQKLDALMDLEIEKLRQGLKGVIRVFQDMVTQLNQATVLVKKEVDKEYLQIKQNN